MQLDTFLTVLSWTTPPIVGAVIGYATNWIAIKMLFRPLRAKYLFGWRLPLTPGVIPRNRKQLAASIGEVVGEKLLSEEAIRKHANDPKFRGVVDGMIPRLLRPALRPLIEPLIRHIIVTFAQQNRSGEVHRGPGQSVRRQRLRKSDSGSNPAASEVDKLVRRPSWRADWLPPACVECADLTLLVVYRRNRTQARNPPLAVRTPTIYPTERTAHSHHGAAVSFNLGQAEVDRLRRWTA